MTADSFKAIRLADPAVLSLMRKIKVNASPDLCALYPESVPGRVRVRMAAGEVHAMEVRYPKGHARNPLTDAGLEDKFRRIFAKQGRMGQCDALLQALWAFDQSKDPGSDVLGLLRSAELPSD